MTTMNTKTPAVKRDYAVQCLVAMHEITAPLLVAAAQGRKLAAQDRIGIKQLPVLAREFVEACGLEHRDYKAHELGSSPTRTQRILGDLHVAVSVCLIDYAKMAVAVAPDMFESKEHEIRRIQDVAVEFVAAVAR